AVAQRNGPGAGWRADGVCRPRPRPRVRPFDCLSVGRSPDRHGVRASRRLAGIVLGRLCRRAVVQTRGGPHRVHHLGDEFELVVLISGTGESPRTIRNKGNHSMNRSLRLVSNRALGIVQVASELPCLRSAGAPGIEDGRSTAALKPMSVSLWLALGWVGLVMPVAAQQ